MQSPGRWPFLSDIVGAQAVHRRQGQLGLRHQGAGATSSHQADEPRPGLPGPRWRCRSCAPCRRTRRSTRRASRRPAAGPYYIAGAHAEAADRAQAEPELPRDPPAQLRQDRLHGRRRTSTPPCCRSRPARPTTPATASPTAYANLWNQFGPTSKPGKAAQAAVLREPDPVDELPGAQHLARVVLERQAAQGGQLRHRPPTLLRQSGAYAGKMTDQILPPGILGYKNVSRTR